LPIRTMRRDWRSLKCSSRCCSTCLRRAEKTKDQFCFGRASERRLLTR